LIDQDEADLIIASQLEYRLIEQIAAAAGTDLAGLRMRRKRAETRIADSTVDGLLSGVISSATRRRLAKNAGTRAQVRDNATDATWRAVPVAIA
jgi:hypothetical protein